MHLSGNEVATTDPLLNSILHGITTLVEGELPGIPNATVLGWREWIRNEEYLLWLRIDHEAVPFIVLPQSRLLNSGMSQTEFDLLANEIRERCDLLRRRCA